MFLNHAFCHFENFEEFRRKLERNLEKDISKRTFLSDVATTPPYTNFMISCALV